MSHTVDVARSYGTHEGEAVKMEKAVAHVLPGEGIRSLRVLGEYLTYKVPSHRTGGAYALFEVSTHPGARPRPRIHHREDESFYVLQGEFKFVVEDSTISASVGSLIYVPKGTLHAHKNVGEEVGRMLLTQTPGGLYEGFLEEAGRPGTCLSSPSLAPTPEEVQKMGELGRKYGIEYPPLSVW